MGIYGHKFSESLHTLLGNIVAFGETFYYIPFDNLWSSGCDTYWVILMPGIKVQMSTHWFLSILVKSVDRGFNLPYVNPSSTVWWLFEWETNSPKLSLVIHKTEAMGYWKDSMSQSMHLSVLTLTISHCCSTVLRMAIHGSIRLPPDSRVWQHHQVTSIVIAMQIKRVNIFENAWKSTCFTQRANNYQ